MTDNNDDDPEYQVGYGKPPLNTRFRKGESGNPCGRRPTDEPSRTPLQLQIDFLAVSEELIDLTINGKRIKKSRAQAVFLKLHQLAINGNMQAITQVLKLKKEFLDDFAKAHPEATALVEEIHRAQMLQPDPLKPEDIKAVNKLHKKTRD